MFPGLGALPTIKDTKRFISRALGGDPNALYVRKSGDESVDGVKTFTSSPVVPASSSPGGAVNEGQLDAAISAVATPAATETTSGKAEIATQSETDAKTDDARIVTPKKLGNGVAFNIAASGFLKFPSWMGSLMIQWGSVNIPTGAGSATWVYPANFPTQVFVVLGTPNGLVNEPVCVLAQNTAQAIVDFASGTNTSNCFMFAIGN